ncbi:methyltransferase family protein [Anseongella ginsenosidimutans]|uniref:Methyltransferase family protein n=1 Tax=Anseongella ginsenosidimutans TaxID=496056 RepID=A0A4R3KT60_9SPHI|nr:class I SAM-dependent methyltransferase [Anseongella ginsenosidimutans]QEC53076.1 class I SAM-dependent methyltransferase [Anseongella ginsenosidimutans]TCS87691.1 methyltransferase family protein [Anseongella ginsenosidimutans]
MHRLNRHALLITFIFAFIISAFIIPGPSLLAQAAPSQTAPYEFRESSSGGTGKFYMGREIAGIMSAAGAAWLERSSRQQEENSNRTISKLPLQPGSVVADVGAGTGYYTFKIAEMIPGGKVYAVDIQDEFVRRLKEKKKAQQAANVEVIKGGEKSPNLPSGSVDLIIMVDVYHELLYPQEMLQAMHKALKPSGKLLLIEYKAEDPEVAIRPLHKMTVAQASKELTANGFKLIKQDNSLHIQHFLLFGKD